MYRKLITGALALALTSASLGGCATNPATGVPEINPAVLTSIETDIQQSTQAICGFVPEIGAVAAVVASYVGAGAVTGIVTTAAQAICTAALSAQTTTPVATVVRGQRAYIRRMVAAPLVNGVPVNGYFVTKN